MSFSQRTSPRSSISGSLHVDMVNPNDFMLEPSLLTNIKNKLLQFFGVSAKVEVVSQMPDQFQKIIAVFKGTQGKLK